jgi:hypothetical protein
MTIVLGELVCSSNTYFGKIKEMKPLLLSIWLFVGLVPAFAADRGHPNITEDSDHGHSSFGHRSAPAPLIGLGIPSALAVGGALLGAKLLKRRR